MDFTIDAQGRTIGRVATEAARILMGKNSVSYKPNVAPKVTVVVENASKISLTPHKRANTVYTRYSGYPGGLKSETLGDVIEKHSYGEAIRRAVRGMLPANKLRKEMLANLIIKE
jgi:large subunit ribosomal protein L13